MRGAAMLMSAVLACSPYRPLREPEPREPPTRAVELPLTEIAGMVVVSLRLGDDPAPLRFVVDLARLNYVVTPAVADRLGLRARGVRYGGELYGAGRSRVAFVALPPVRLGELELVGGQALVADLDGLSQQLCVPIDGVIGLDAYGSPAHELDYAAGVLRIAGSAEQLPARPGGAEVESSVPLGGAFPTTLVELATTFRGAIEVDAEYRGRVVKLAALGVDERTVVDGYGGPWFVWPDRRIGELDLRGVDAAMVEHGLGLRIGARVLRAFTVRRAGGRTWLYPNGRPLPRGLVSFGFAWEADGGEARISAISDGTRALGLQYKQRILAIDGHVLAELAPEALCRLRRDWEDGGDVVRVTVEEPSGEGSVARTVEVRRRSLLGEAAAQ